ncbi:MAG: bacillithiol transferase BstA [Ignavibacteriaceae bacterium]
MTDLRYPIGKFSFRGNYSNEEIASFIDEIEALPTVLKHAVAGLNEAQLNTPYREGGWTVKQVIHHLADSHINAYVRTKLALTESDTTIKTYDQEKWANTKEIRLTPVSVSIDLLSALHMRWVLLLRSLEKEQLKKNFIHPESGIKTIEWLIALYAWHGNHHTAHITSLKERMGW